MQHVSIITIILSFLHHPMKPTSFTQRLSVIHLLQEGYSLCQIQSKTTLGKSTVSRIKKELDMNKENHRGGRPSKLSPGDKRSLIRQITTGRLDNAVEATHFINQTLSNSVTPQTVRNALKKDDFCSVVKRKRPLLKKAH